MVAFRLSIGNYVDDPELKLPKISSLCIILGMNVLLQVGTTACRLDNPSI